MRKGRILGVSQEISESVVVSAMRMTLIEVQNGLFFSGNNKELPKGFKKYVGGSISFRPDIQRPRQMQNALRDI